MPLSNPFESKPFDTPGPDQFGLHILHEPRHTIINTLGLPASISNVSGAICSTVITIVLVHGLGGSSIKTWTHSETNSFWPTWLAEMNGFENVRITTFGYGARWSNIMASRNVLGVTDFANQLLDALDLHYTEYGNVRSLSGIADV